MSKKIEKILFYVDLGVFILAVAGIIVNAILSNTKLIAPFVILAIVCGITLLRVRNKGEKIL